MADHGNYSHIKVNAGEEEDIVIQAGQPAFRHDNSSQEGNKAVEGMDEPKGSSPEPHVEEAPISESSQKPKKDDGYHPTTLEDIESYKAPLVQKIVIAVALIALVAFALWYFIFFIF